MSDARPPAVIVEGLSRAFDIHHSDRARARHALWAAAAHLPVVGSAAARRSLRLSTRTCALRDVSFTVSAGESVGIVGANGSGKSTLLHILCGTLSPTAGTVTTRGRLAALLELGTGFVADLTGRENLRLSGLLHGLDDATIASRAAAIAAFADIGAYLDQPVRTYSSGMYVRLAFAVMAHLDADVLIVDEALAVGDIRFVQKCLAYLDRFRAGGGTLLFVSHDLAAVRRLCTRALWLDGGTLRMDGAPRVVTEAYFDGMVGLGTAAPVHPLEPAVDGPPRGLDADGDRDWTTERSERPHPTAALPRDASPAPGALPAHDAQGSSHAGSITPSGVATIVEVHMRDGHGRPLTTVAGGEQVTLCVGAVTPLPLQQPIIGFYVKDRLGQQLFGENTLAAAATPATAAAGSRLDAQFTFTMPKLFPGEYLVAVAIAEGTQAAHLHHEWRHDAWHFTSAWPGAATGLVGIDVCADLRVTPAGVEATVSAAAAAAVPTTTSGPALTS